MERRKNFSLASNFDLEILGGGNLIGGKVITVGIGGDVGWRGRDFGIDNFLALGVGGDGNLGVDRIVVVVGKIVVESEIEKLVIAKD